MKMFKAFANFSFTLLLTAMLVHGTAAIAAAQTPTFTLPEHIGKAWENELVTYKLTAEQARAIKGMRLVGNDQKAVAYQYDDVTSTLSFQATLKPFATSVYQFTKDKPDLLTDLKVVEQGNVIEISNTFTGVRIAKTISGESTDVPLQSWRLASGKWVGSAKFTKSQNVKKYSAKIVEQGPVRVRVVSEMTFDNGDSWTMTFELQANEPAVLIDETFDCDIVRSFEFDFSKDFDPTYTITRASSVHEVAGNKHKYGFHVSQNVTELKGRLMSLTPWIHWGGYPLLSSHLNLADGDWKDLFYLATRNAERWTDPSIESSKRASRAANLNRSEQGQITLQYDLAHGQRSYLIGSQAGTQERKIVDEGLIIPGPGQHMQMRHSDYPLDRVKDFVLAWDAPPLASSGFLSPEHVKELLADYQYTEKTLVQARKTIPNVFTLETSLPLYLATQDKELERKLIDAALQQVQSTLDLFLQLEHQITVPMAPHHVARLQTTCNMISVIYDSPQLTADERAKLKAQLAFLGYLFNSDSYCSTARGYAGFPNMTACVYGTRAAIGSVLPGHPLRKEWMTNAVADLRREFLDHWIDADGKYNGSHIEALTYSRLTFDLVLGAIYRLYRSGADPDAIFHPAIKQFGLWHANTSTPRDERLLGWRHDPPVGNNYNFDLSPGLYAILAFMWRERDPEFAGNMKWMQMQQGNTVFQAIGGFTPAFAGYRKLFMANNIKPIAPHYVSNVWNETSVILRSHYNDELENMLYVIAGTGHSHYDQDSGSVTMFGKGQIISDDFGYYSYAPPTDASMIDSPLAPGSSLMQVDKFAADETIDYFRGSKKMWRRRVQHIKHPDPKGPNYFVIHDGLNMTGPATWRMWFTAKDVELHDNMAVARGLYNVDSEIHFASLPEGAKLTKEDMTRKGYGLDYQGKYNLHDSTQTGVIIQSGRFKGLLTLVFPRLKDEAPPKVTAIADGNGFKIVTPQATDYVFMANKPIKYSEGDLNFEGTAGFVRVVGDEVTLRLNEGGDIRYGKHHLSSDEESPTRNVGGNLFPDGDLKSGEMSILPALEKETNIVVTLEQGTPAGIKNSDMGPEDYYQKVVFGKGARGHLYLTTRSLFVDPTKMYRASMSLYLPTTKTIQIGTYAGNAKNAQITLDNGKTWEWRIVGKGPTDGFKKFEVTLGPEGSGADYIFPPDAVSLRTLLMRTYGEGDTVYIRNFTFEPIGKP